MDCINLPQETKNNWGTRSCHQWHNCLLLQKKYLYCWSPETSLALALEEKKTFKFYENTPGNSVLISYTIPSPTLPPNYYGCEHTLQLKWSDRLQVMRWKLTRANDFVKLWSLLWKPLFHGFGHSVPSSSCCLSKHELAFKSVLGLFSGVFFFLVGWLFCWFGVFLSTAQIEKDVTKDDILILWTGIFERA